MPDSNVEVKAIFEEDAPPCAHRVHHHRENGTETARLPHLQTKAVAGTEIRLTATPNTGYHFKEWQVMSGGVTIMDDKFTMPDGNVEVKAIFEKDAACFHRVHHHRENRWKRNGFRISCKKPWSARRSP